jgi:hypothetical protein
VAKYDWIEKRKVSTFGGGWDGRLTNQLMV